MKRDFDVMVIGSGPGGEGAAMKLSKEGKRVAMVERFPRVGGNCTHRGTIPSKMLRHAVQRLSQGADAQKVKYPDLLKLAQGVITRQVDLRQGFYDRNDVTLIHGRASFADANTLRIHTDTGEESYTADHFIIATGARSYHPADIGTPS